MVDAAATPPDPTAPKPAHSLPPKCEMYPTWRGALAYAVRCAWRAELLAFDELSSPHDREVIYRVLDCAGRLCIEPAQNVQESEELAEWITNLKTARATSSAGCSKAIECCIEVARCAQVGLGFSGLERAQKSGTFSTWLEYKSEDVERLLSQAWAFASNAAVRAYEAAQLYLDISNEVMADFLKIAEYQFGVGHTTAVIELDRELYRPAP